MHAKTTENSSSDDDESVPLAVANVVFFVAAVISGGGTVVSASVACLIGVSFLPSVVAVVFGAVAMHASAHTVLEKQLMRQPHTS